MHEPESPPSDLQTAPRRSTPARVLVLEDHPVVREGLVQIIGSEPDFLVVAAVGGRAEARKAVVEQAPELVVQDLMLDGSDSLDLLSELTKERPALRILVCSMMSESVYAERALRAGAMGYVMKTAPVSELLQAMQSILGGRIYLSPRIGVTLFRGLFQRTGAVRHLGESGLSDRELQVFQLIGAGVPNRQIAQQLGISVKTVETHRENLKVKLGLSDASGLAHAAQAFVSALAGGGVS